MISTNSSSRTKGDLKDLSINVLAAKAGHSKRQHFVCLPCRLVRRRACRDTQTARILVTNRRTSPRQGCGYQQLALRLAHDLVVWVRYQLKESRRLYMGLCKRLPGIGGAIEGRARCYQ